jgi:hypothetical protein
MDIVVVVILLEAYNYFKSMSLEAPVSDIEALTLLTARLNLLLDRSHSNEYNIESQLIRHTRVSNRQYYARQSCTTPR